MRGTSWLFWLVPYHLQNIMPTCRLDCEERHFEDFNFVVKYYRDNIYDRRDATWAKKTRQDSFNIIDMRCVVSIAYFKRELLLQDIKNVIRKLNLPKPHLSVKLITSSKRYLSRYQKKKMLLVDSSLQERSPGAYVFLKKGRIPFWIKFFH